MDTRKARDRWRSESSMSGHVAAWVAWGTCALYWIGISTGYALQLWHGTALPFLDEVGWRVAYGSCATVGALIVSRRPRNRIGWILCAIGLSSAVAGFAQDYASFALLRRQQSLPGGLVMGWLGSWPWYIAFGLILTFLILLFPNGQLPSRRWRPVAWLAAGAITLQCIWAAFAPRTLEGRPGMPQNPWAPEPAEELLALLGTWTSLLLPVLAVLSLTSLVVRFRRSRGVERQQLKWFTYGALLVAGSWAVITPTGLGEALTSPLWSLFTALSGWIIPGAIGIAVLRYRLYDIDRILNRTLVYVLLTVLLGGIYAGVVLVLGQLFGQVGDPPSWVIAGATLAVAALFQPARRRIQEAVDRRFNRHRYDKAKTVHQFSNRLRDHIDLDTLSTELLAVVHQTVEPTTASLWFRAADRRPVAGGKADPQG
jgi:hypothetical protein